MPPARPAPRFRALQGERGEVRLPGVLKTSITLRGGEFLTGIDLGKEPGIQRLR